MAHADSQLDPEALRRYLLAYQSVQPLTIGELWAVPITLRIVLIEDLRGIAGQVVDDAAARQVAEDLAERMQAADWSAAHWKAANWEAAGLAPGRTPERGRQARQN